MTEEVMKPVSGWKVRAVMLLAMTAPFVGSVMAAISFANITEVINAVVDLLPSFMDMAIAAAPVIITIAIIAFVVGFLKKILSMLGLGGMK